MHGRQTSYTNRAFNSLQFGVFYGIFERTVDFLCFFCATKVVWMCIHAYGGEWVNADLFYLEQSSLHAVDTLCTGGHQHLPKKLTIYCCYLLVVVVFCPLARMFFG